jgi:hypothetical protein
MSDIEKIMEMTFCSREDAETALKKMGNALEAICFLMEVPLKTKERTQEQKLFDEMRRNLAGIEERSIQSISADQLFGSAQDETQTHPEETSLQNDCSHKCQPDVQASEAEKQETGGP